MQRPLAPAALGEFRDPHDMVTLEFAAEAAVWISQLEEIGE